MSDQISIYPAFTTSTTSSFTCFTGIVADIGVWEADFPDLKEITRFSVLIKRERLRNPTGHGGVYKVDGHGRPGPSVGEENSTFLPSHGGRSPRPPLHFLSPWARRDVSLPAKKFSTFFRSDGMRSAAEAKRFSDSDRSYIIHTNGFTPFHSRSALHRIATANEGPITVKN